MTKEQIMSHYQEFPMIDKQIAYIVRRGDSYAVQKTDVCKYGSEHEVNWREGLTLAEADTFAADCVVARRDD